MNEHVLHFFTVVGGKGSHFCEHHGGVQLAGRQASRTMGKSACIFPRVICVVKAGVLHLLE